MKVECWRSRILTDLGEAYLLAAHEREASEAADSALELAREHGERGHEAWCLRLLGEIALYRRRPDETQSHFRNAIELATALGMRPLVAHSHFGLARLYRSTGERDEARGSLATATTMFREMDMGLWLEPAEAELRES